MIEIYLVRHGQTMLNKMEKVQGWVDSPLTKEGIEIAELCGLGLNEIDFDVAYSSDFMRAIKTTEIILSQHPNKNILHHYHKGLRELSFGDYDGGYDIDRKRACSKYFLGEDNLTLLNEKLKSKEIVPRQMMNATYEMDQSGYAESFDQVEKRAANAIKNIFENAKENQHKKILIVSHGVTIATILEHFPGEKLDKVSDMKNASVSLLTYEHSEIIVKEAVSMRYVEAGQTLKQKLKI